MATGDKMGVFQDEVDLLVGEVFVVVVVMGVVNIVEVVGTPEEHLEECNIEWGALVDVVGEVVVGKVVEKEPRVVDDLELVGGEAAFGGMRWRGLLVGPQCRVVLHIFFGSPFPAISTSLEVCVGLHRFLFFLFWFCWRSCRC